VIKAFEGRGPIHIIHFDAHLDFVDERHGVRYGHGNPLRRASEMNHIVGMTQMGIRNVSSSNRDDYEAAHEAGSKILSVRDVRRLGVEGVLALIPQNINYYITIDIDGFDPSIAPGTGTPSHSTTKCWKSSRPWPSAARATSSAWTWWKWHRSTTRPA
jgi:agmatinase